VIVVDASAMVAALVVEGDRASALRDRLRGERLQAPHLLDIEVLSALRRLSRASELAPDSADRAVALLRRWPLRRHPHSRLLSRVHQLRDSVTSYDATYLALAEAIGAPLVTCDGPLARAHGHTATIEHHPI
jgi:predicted nucleic acid-binding protein